MEELQPYAEFVTINCVTYHGTEVWGDDGLVRVTFTGGSWRVSSDLFEPADLPHAWDQAEHRLRFHVANRAAQMALI